MKFAHVAPFFYPEIGGMESAVLNQCRELVNVGNELNVCACNRFRNERNVRSEL